MWRAMLPWVLSLLHLRLRGRYGTRCCLWDASGTGARGGDEPVQREDLLFLLAQLQSKIRRRSCAIRQMTLASYAGPSSYANVHM